MRTSTLRIVMGVLVLLSAAAQANQVQVSNVQGRYAQDMRAQVVFDLSWQNSWRSDLPGAGQHAPHNWDAAWVFVKYRSANGTEWRHATLADTGHVAPAGATIDVTEDGKGAFVYRAANGTGAFTAEGIELIWDHVVDEADAASGAELAVFAIEMVHVPDGAFAVGSGGNGVSEFYAGGGGNSPFWITSEDAITVGTGSGALYYPSSTHGGDRSGPIPAAFPKGFSAFYVMKTPISQGQYCDFLNSLTSAQAATRYPGESTFRHAITISGGVYTSANWYVACNFLSWADVTAYLDWAGLRPMTELEYEKACRGPLTPVANEYAWGTVDIAQATGIANAGAANETASNTGANAAYGNHASVQGPLRVGSFARGGTTRQQAGAGYYGALDLSGNLWERPVTVGHATGRAFTGVHGDGALDASGNADVTNWPGTTAGGAGFRGGNWPDAVAYLRVADRIDAAGTYAGRNRNYGGRGVRLAPRGVE